MARWSTNVIYLEVYIGFVRLRSRNRLRFRRRMLSSDFWSHAGQLSGVMHYRLSRDIIALQNGHTYVPGTCFSGGKNVRELL